MSPLPVYVLGDIHGQYEKVVRHLQRAKLIDHQQRWTGGKASLWCVGDFFNRGPHAIEALNLVMRLQREARAVGGTVGAVLGNHDIYTLGVHRMGPPRAQRPRATRPPALTGAQAAWLSQLPAMVLLDDILLQHSDTTGYRAFGRSIQEINDRIGDILHSRHGSRWGALLRDIGGHRMFVGEHGETALLPYLKHFRAACMVHGHSPISTMTTIPDKEVTTALIYAHRRCINVDGGMYRGGPGFLYQLIP